MISIILATLAEAQPFLQKLGAVRKLDQPFPTYAFPAGNANPGGLIIISGMGPGSAGKAALYAIRTRGLRTIINAGVCGSLREADRIPHERDLSPGNIFVVPTVIDGDAWLDGEREESLDMPLPACWRNLPQARLATVSNPVFGGHERTRLASLADLVEMEGYAIARVSREQGAACILIKGVSDFATESGRDDLHRNLTAASAAVADAVIGRLNHYLPARQNLAVRMCNLVKVEHTLFSLPLLFAGAWIGAGYRWPGGRVLLLVALAGLGARALGMAMNRILDRHLDQLNPRTLGRDLPAGRLTLAQGWCVAVSGLVVYLAACTALGPVCLKLSPVPAAVLIGYSLLKRFTPLCHFGIGLTLAFGPLGAYVAVTGKTEMTPVIMLLSLFTFCWISASDILYALQDIESDRETGVHSIPVSTGPIRARWIAGGIHLIAWMATYWIWRMTGSGLTGAVALCSAGLALALMYYERLPLSFRFFPVSAIAGVAGALVPLLASR